MKNFLPLLLGKIVHLHNNFHFPVYSSNYLLLVMPATVTKRVVVKVMDFSHCVGPGFIRLVSKCNLGDNTRP